MECPICFEHKPGITTICNHTFCEDCITAFCVKTLNCPLCRQLILDEPISIKILNDSIKNALTNSSIKHQNKYWSEYLSLQQQVSDGILQQDDMGEKMIHTLIDIIGENGKCFIHVQIIEAILHRTTYLETPLDDWRWMFVKMK